MLTALQKLFYVWQVFETEVNNEEISQFIFNSRHYAADVLETLKVIGAANVYKILHCAADKFPDGIIPLSHDKREVILEKIEDIDD